MPHDPAARRLPWRCTKDVFPEFLPQGFHVLLPGSAISAMPFLILSGESQKPCRESRAEKAAQETNVSPAEETLRLLLPDWKSDECVLQLALGRCNPFISSRKHCPLHQQK